MEKRGLKYHRERKGEALREEIEIILEGELADPRIGLVHVSEVKLAPDGRSRPRLVNVDGDDEEAEKKRWRASLPRSDSFAANLWSDFVSGVLPT